LSPKKGPLTPDETNKGLRSIIFDGIFSNAMVTLSSGAFLVAFALALGASNATIGFLAAIPFLGNMFQLVAIFLVEKSRRRKAISFTASTLSRALLLIMALIPFLFMRVALSLLPIILFLSAAIAAFSNSAWNSWMRDLVPTEIRGAYFSRRLSLALIVGIVLNLLAARFIDLYKVKFADKFLYGYSMLFVGAFIFGMLSSYFLYRTPEPKMLGEPAGFSFVRTLISPFKDVNFKNLIYFTCTWAFALNLAIPFFTVYMLNRLGLSLSMVIIFAVISQITNISFLTIWGRFTDRFSNKSVLSVSGILYLIALALWPFTTLPERYALSLFVLGAIHILLGIATAGVAISSGYIAFKLAPEGQATSYLSVNNSLVSLFSAIAPFLGGVLADRLISLELALNLKWLSSQNEFIFNLLNFKGLDFLFLIAIIIGFYALHRLTLVSEKGEVEKGIVYHELIKEVRRAVRNLSTVAGISYLVNFPIRTMKRTVGRKKKNSVN